MIWDEVNATNTMKWRWFIVPTKVEQINENLFLDTYAMAWMKWRYMIRHECGMKQQSQVSTRSRYQSRGSPGEYRLYTEEKKSEKDEDWAFWEKRGRQIRYRWVERRCRRSEMMRELTKIRGVFCTLARYRFYEQLPKKCVSLFRSNKPLIEFVRNIFVVYSLL